MMVADDDAPGKRIELGGHRFTAEEIITFASKWDPQTFHTDAHAAKHSHFGGLCASGWHTACVWMKLYIRHVNQRAAGQPPRLGPSPGFRDMVWKLPVYADDTIRYSTEIIETRPLASRPGWTVETSRNEGVKEDGALAFSFTSTVFVERQQTTE